MSTREKILAALQPGVVLETTQLAQAIREDHRVAYATARKMALEGTLQKSRRQGTMPSGATPPVRWRRKPV